MLQQETVAEVTPLPNIPRSAAAPTPQELAQAVVAVEARQKDVANVETASGVTAQIIAQCGLDITPSRLLTEVQEQRTRMARETAMTKRKLRDPIFWLLVAGTVASTVAALFLLFTAYRFAEGMRARSEALAKSEALVAHTAGPPASELVGQWIYPHSYRVGSSSDASLSSVKLATPAPYYLVWTFYAVKTSFPYASSYNQSVWPPPDSIHTSGLYTEDGKPIKYEIISDGASPSRLATFIQHKASGTVTTILTYDAAHKQTNILVTATTPNLQPGQ